MKTYSFSHKETGIFNGSLFSTDDESQLAANVPVDHQAIEGAHDHLSRRVDVATGALVDYQPPAPSADHEWNADTKRWQLSAAAQAKVQARAAAAARIAALEAAQHAVVRDLLLGSLSARPRLQAIADEIAALNAQA